MKTAKALLGFVLIFTSFQSFAGNYTDPDQIKDDSELIMAIKAKKNAFYVQAADLEVTKILPEDKNGTPHEKWRAELSNGDSVTIVYNLDMGDHVPIKVGDHFDVGGQFLWLGNNGMVHWTHDDPKGKRPDGYVIFNGTVYGDTDKSMR